MKTTESLEHSEQSASGVPSCSTPDPIALVREEHCLQMELCDLLEAIADGLPSVFDRDLAAIAVSMLQGSVAAHTKFEDEALFPVLEQRLGPTDPVMEALACLKEEHDRDEDIVRELTVALRTALATGSVQAPETLGYVLRGYFESQRRHIAWENRIVLPAAEASLTSDDLNALQVWIMQSQHPRCSKQSMLTIRAARSGSSVCKDCQSSVAPTEFKKRGDL